jgi:hypothetical protein
VGMGIPGRARRTSAIVDRSRGEALGRRSGAGRARPRAPLCKPGRALSRDTAECRGGITARALSRHSRHSRARVGARSVIVRAMTHDGPAAIVRETHSCETGHKGASYKPRRGTPSFSLSAPSFLVHALSPYKKARAKRKRGRESHPLPRAPLFSRAPFSRSITR